MSTTVAASSLPWLSELHAVALATLDRNVVRDATGPFIRAGAGYADPWTRDAALNCWGAANLFRPAEARATLLRVCQPDGGRLLIAQDDQRWDQIVWVLAAWDHYLLTGDGVFLVTAWRIGRDSLAVLHRSRFRAEVGLYAGPALMQDGISGLPSPPATTDEPSSFVLDYPDAHEIVSLSTNVLYLMALNCLAAMTERLGEPGATEFRARAAALAAAVEEQLRDGDSYGYFRSGSGELDHHREAAGLALAVVSGLVPSERGELVLNSVGRGPAGAVNVAPHFPDRYSDTRPGRHNVTCWPMVMGLVGLAEARAGDREALHRTLTDLHRLVQASEGRFDEVYDAISGRPHGGWQCGHAWDSEPDQTWSATSFLRLVHLGLVGLDPGPDGLSLRPAPVRAGETVTVRNLPYRGALLDIDLEGGDGSSVHLDDRDVTAAPNHVPTDLEGRHRVRVVVGDRP